MFKKYKIKKRKKSVNPYHIFVIFAIALLFVSYGYSYLSDNMTITGKANILAKSSEDIEYGNSTYKWKLAYNWQNGDGSYVYAMQIDITNLDEDYKADKGIVVSFDLPDSCIITDLTNINIWQAESFSLEGNTLTVNFKPSSSWLPMGETLTLYPHLYFSKEVTPTITNLTFAGKRATLVDE